MATVTTTITPELDIFPLAGYVEPGASSSYYARGIAVFKSINAAIAAAGVGDNQHLVINFSLPQNFAFSLCNFTLGIRTNAAQTNNWGDNADFSMHDAATGASRTMDVQLGAYANGVTQTESTNLEIKNYKLWNIWATPMKPVIGDAVYAALQIYNETANDGAYTVDCTCSFLQFDINQIHNVGVNSPVPTRVC